ncbi:hypothetical protein ACFY9C_35180 [Streptomyces filamentosus]|uniref:hypothetical protein n=1 Tax=Streptomyces filamentosus TaxID=67294 RepID=UPI0036F15396
MQTPESFRAEHGDCTTWTAEEFDAYEYVVEADDPAFVAATATGLKVYGRSRQHGRIAVTAVTADYLVWRRENSALHALLGGGKGSGKSRTDLPAFFEPARRAG